MVEPERPGHRAVVAAAPEEGRGYDGPMARTAPARPRPGTPPGQPAGGGARDGRVGAVVESDEAETELDLAESLLVAAEAHLAGGDTRRGDRGRRAPARSTPSITAAVSGVGGARPERCCCGRGRSRVRRSSSPARSPPTPRCSTRSAAGPTPCGPTSWLPSCACRLGDLDGAEELMPARRPHRALDRRAPTVRLAGPRPARVGPRQPRRGAPGGQPRRASAHRPPGRARGTRAARLRRGRRRSAWRGTVRPAGDRGRTPAASCSPSSKRPRRTSSLLPAGAARPMTTCSPSSSPGCGSSAARQWEAMADPDRTGPARRGTGRARTPHPQPRAAGAGGGRPGGRPLGAVVADARRSPSSWSTPTSTAPCCAVCGGRQPGGPARVGDGRRVGRRDRQLRPQPAPAQPGAGLGEPPRELAAETLRAVGGSRSPTGSSRGGVRAVGSSRRHRAHGRARTACPVEAPPGPARAAGLGHAVADGMGDRPPARRRCAAGRARRRARPGATPTPRSPLSPSCTTTRPRSWSAPTRPSDRCLAALGGSRPHAHRLPRLVPPRQPAVLHAAARRRRADGLRPGATCRRCRRRSSSRRATWRWGRR